MALAVFKTVRRQPSGWRGGFDSLSLPPHTRYRGGRFANRPYISRHTAGEMLSLREDLLVSPAGVRYVRRGADLAASSLIWPMVRLPSGCGTTT